MTEETTASPTDEINDMLESVGMPKSAPEETEETAKVEETVTEEVVAEETTEEVKEEPVEEETVEEEVVEEEPAEEAKSDAETAETYEKKLESLRKTISDMGSAAPAATPIEQATKPEAKVVQYVESGEAFDKIHEDPKILNEVLNKVGEEAYQRMLLEVAPLVQRSVAHQVGISDMVRNFYTANPDLAGYKGFVAHVTRTTMTENPDIGQDELLTKVEETAREQLNLPKKTEPVKSRGRPRGPKTPTARVVVPPETDLDKQFKDILPEGFVPYEKK